jgi:hypothetical protein
MARWQALEKLRTALAGEFPVRTKDLRLNSMDLVVETVRLILLPLWLVMLRDGSKRHPIRINGQTGDVL